MLRLFELVRIAFTLAFAEQDQDQFAAGPE